jgi:hypothetical protein
MLIIFLIYIGIGVVLNFTPPLKRKIWVAQMNAASSDNATPIRLVLFTVVIRLGVVVFYPLFLLKR